MGASDCALAPTVESAGAISTALTFGVRVHRVSSVRKMSLALAFPLSKFFGNAWLKILKKPNRT